MSDLSKFRGDQTKEWSSAVWDGLINAMIAALAPLEEQLGIERRLTDQVVARGLQIIEEKISPAITIANGKISEIEVQRLASLAAAAQIIGLVALYEGDTLDATFVNETGIRRFVTTATIAEIVAAARNNAALIGNATAPNVTAGDNSQKIANTAFVKTALDGLVSAAPGALDTLDELAAALGDDANFATTMTNALAGLTTGLGGKQASNVNLTGLAGLTSAADRFAYFNGSGGSTALGTLTAFVRTLMDDVDASTFLSTLGVSTFIKGLLDDGNASTAQTTLGFSNYAKTLIGDADYWAALSTLGVQDYVKGLFGNTNGSDFWYGLGARASAGSVGYEKSPFGLVRQWGSSVVTLNGGGDATINFPLTFSNAYTVIAMGGDHTAAPGGVVSIAGWSNSGFNIHVQGAGAMAYRCNWLAAGAA